MIAIVRTVFMHGAGRHGPAAWPVQVRYAPDDWVFLDRAPAGDDPAGDASRILAALGGAGGGGGGSGGVVVAASYGALAAMLAAGRAPDRVHGLVLCEPACLSVARGRPGVEAHVAALAPVFEHAADPAVSNAEFSRLFAEGMGTPVPDLPPDRLDATVRRLRATTPPWAIQVDPAVPRRVPVLILTGGSDAMFDEIADALAASGAEHRAVPGGGHRPQDRPAGDDAIRRFLAA